ncbi:hypothetical protein TNCV_4200261 [Trichonephila clavipes]|uniref:Uncharacterized protein n=1 Tax=Trichonephila clavipes TaxID=2585209 RepID=A0A8X6WCG8_TRICX|nr:hypothetical protein TNCV_4200261 [Trichonephila clavipes]
MNQHEGYWGWTLSQVTRTTPKLEPFPQTSASRQREDIDRFNVHQPLFSKGLATRFIFLIDVDGTKTRERANNICTAII